MNDYQELAALLSNQVSLSDPIRYANIVRATQSKEIANISQLIPQMKEQLERFEKVAKHAEEFRKQVSGENYARKRQDAKKMFEGLDQQQDNFRGIPVDISILLSSHYDNVVNLYSALVQGYELIANAKMISFDDSVQRWSEDLNKNQEILGADRIRSLIEKGNEAKVDALQSLALEQNINRGASNSFLQGLAILEKIPKIFEAYLSGQARNYEAYYERLRHRHSNGIVICNAYGIPSVTLTDVSILVWDNVDKVGEIESGHSRDQLSAYTLHRANAMIEAAKQDEVWPWLLDPGDQLVAWAELVKPNINAVWQFVIKFKEMLGESTWRLRSMDVERFVGDFADIITSLDLRQITQRPPERAFSKTERFAMDHRNEAISMVGNLLVNGEGLQTIVEKVLELKVKEREFFVNENSFYVCRIGTGNVFSGEAPGALEVIPGEKPNADLTKIWGGGFDEIRDFIAGMDEAKKWQPLFLSTSPSKSTDKNNILLVGPQGCGKTELMRAVGSTKGNVAIFAVGSSFLTCWLGEAQKNPGRLFDEAVKLHKTSGRPVYILIDEIDSVLNNDQNASSRVNLSTEFQNLMDGVVAYPGLTVIGATNFPQRIPTPMLRRFAKVLVVGELSLDDTKSILRHYLENFLPCSEFSDEQYTAWAKRLEGATGDLLRKMIDEVWLGMMRGYIADHRDQAEEVLTFLKERHGETFEVANLTDEDRQQVKEMIGKNVMVTAEVVSEHITKLLDNFAIQQQIKVAKDTYRESKKLLARQKAGEKDLGF